MPRRLVILVLVCALSGALAAGVARAAGTKPLLPGTVPSPTHFVPPPAPPPPTMAERAVRLARTQLGVPYVYGGASPGGFDCSGLVVYVFAQVGISLPHYTGALWNVGVPVSYGGLQPGDLVFFNGLGHVGIYIGGGQMVHSPHTGDVVKISDISSGYYASSFVGARRVG